RQAAEEKQRAQDAARARFIEQAQIDTLERQCQAAEASAASQHPPRPAKRTRLSANATPEEKAAHAEEKKKNKHLYDKAYYQCKKQIKIEHQETQNTSIGMSQVPDTISLAQPAITSAPFPTEAPIITFQAKQELIESQVDFSAPMIDSAKTSHPPTSPLRPATLHAPPITPGPSSLLMFVNSTAETFRQTLQQPTPVSQPKKKSKGAPIISTPSQPKA
ncbi:hypothetical protein FRC06_011126, partial [Ceratobasidium sp. 370]